MVTLGRIRVVPLADESLGVRSMAVFVETPDVAILLDAGASLAPRRFGLPPHPAEFRAIRSARKRISAYSEKADVIVISHYHLDHYTPKISSWYEWCSPEDFDAVYSGKIVLAKDINRDINFSQKRRGLAMKRHLEEVASKLRYVDSKTIELSNTRLSFSEPMPHGPPGTPLGYVIVTTIEYYDEKLVFAPDVQGPASEEALRYIISQEPSAVIIGGPPLYLAGKKVDEAVVKEGINSLKILIGKTPGTVVLSHHILRDSEWRESLEQVGISSRNLRLYSDLLGLEYAGLEALRRELYRMDPPTNEYLDWLKKLKRGRADGPPPV